MPIRPENKSRYPKNWKEISKRIRFERAGNKCEQCNAPNGELIVRGTGSDAGTYMLWGGEIHDDQDGEFYRIGKGSEYNCAGKFTRVVLTVAHLDHQPENNAEENLKALCQKCHLAHDREQHKATRAKTRRNHTKELFQ